MDALIRDTSEILFAFTRAYDRTWRFGILWTLHGFGMRRRLPLYIQNFLSRRTFRTKVGTTFSEEHVQNEGVPQVSVLSCTLFSIAINGILAALPADVRGSLYVDDFMIYCSGLRFAGLERKIIIIIFIQICYNGFYNRQ